MKVLHIITDTNFGGAGRYLTYLLSQPAFDGIDVCVACPDGELGKRLDAMGVRRIAISGRDVSYSSRLTRELYALLGRERPDLVHTHSSLSGRIAARFRRIPVVYTKHGETPGGRRLGRALVKPGAAGSSGSVRRTANPFGRLLQRTAARALSDKIIAVSGRVKDELVDSGIDPSMIVAIPNGIDLSPYKKVDGAGAGSHPEDVMLRAGSESGSHAGVPVSSESGSHASVPVSSESASHASVPVSSESARYASVPAGTQRRGFLIGGLARLSREKGLDVMLDAAKLVLASEPSARFVIGGSGPLEDEIRSRIRDLRLEPYVKMAGFVEDVPGFLSRLDMFVLPSDSEGIGLAVMEAMAAGLPVVATDVGGVPEVVSDGQTGILVPPRQPRLLAQAIVRLLVDPDLAKSMGIAGQNRVEALFDAKVMAERTVAVYRDLVSRSSQR